MYGVLNCRYSYYDVLLQYRDWRLPTVCNLFHLLCWQTNLMGTHHIGQLACTYHSLWPTQRAYCANIWIALDFCKNEI